MTRGIPKADLRWEMGLPPELPRADDTWRPQS
jgi:hypothetical protein